MAIPRFFDQLVRKTNLLDNIGRVKGPDIKFPSNIEANYMSD